MVSVEYSAEVLPSPRLASQPRLSYSVQMLGSLNRFTSIPEDCHCRLLLRRCGSVDIACCLGVHDLQGMVESLFSRQFTAPTALSMPQFGHAEPATGRSRLDRDNAALEHESQCREGRERITRWSCCFGGQRRILGAPSPVSGGRESRYL